MKNKECTCNCDGCSKVFSDCCGFVINEEGYLVGEIKDKADCEMCH